MKHKNSQFPQSISIIFQHHLKCLLPINKVVNHKSP